MDGKRIELKVAAYDEKGLIGQGTHERFIITDERFLSKTSKKCWRAEECPSRECGTTSALWAGRETF